MKKILVVLGPTATGKTDLAFNLAKKLKGELVACDSRQVYRGLDIGTGKMPNGKVRVGKGKGFWKINGVRVWMYDVMDLKNQYTVADYVKDASKAVDRISKSGKLPIVVGGTGLYFKALLEGLSNLGAPVDYNLREQLNNLTVSQLQENLQNLNKKRWQSLNESDRQNPRRLIRQIELIMMYPYKQVQNSKFKIQNFNVIKIGLTAPQQVLYERINNKALEWMELGIVDEVRNLLRDGVTKERIMELGLGYAVVVEYLDEKISLNQMIEKMQNKIRQYAKRQITWFRKEKEIFWFDITNENYADKVEKIVTKWYDSGK